MILASMRRRFETGRDSSGMPPMAFPSSTKEIGRSAAAEKKRAAQARLFNISSGFVAGAAYIVFIVCPLLGRALVNQQRRARMLADFDREAALEQIAAGGFQRDIAVE